MPWRYRPDGDYVKDLPNIRRMMPFLMRGKMESALWWEQKFDVTKTDEFLAKYNQQTGRRVTCHHLIIWAAVLTINDRPRLNRFIAGGRVFQRRGIQISFSAKKKKDDNHPLVTVKRTFDPSWSFEKFVDVIDGDIKESRSDKESKVDKEVKFFLRIPTVLLWMMVAFVKFLDRFSLLPGWFIKDDPMFASMFIANLGSLNMDAGYHHLYEYGNIPLFTVIGKRKMEPVVDAATGQVVARPIVTLRHLYDERVEDGLYMAKVLELFRDRVEDPGKHIRIGPEPTMM